MADGFDILLGSVEVTVPWVIDGGDYQIVCEHAHIYLLLSSYSYRTSVFGDSGNFSPMFTIRSA